MLILDPEFKYKAGTWEYSSSAPEIIQTMALNHNRTASMSFQPSSELITAHLKQISTLCGFFNDTDWISLSHTHTHAHLWIILVSCPNDTHSHINTHKAPDMILKINHGSHYQPICALFPVVCKDCAAIQSVCVWVNGFLERCIVPLASWCCHVRFMLTELAKESSKCWLQMWAALPALSFRVL